jgi:large subunit ribosomal protein L19
MEQILGGKTDIPDVHPGDTVKVNLKVKEGNREYTQSFQGLVIKLRKGKSFTVRRVAYGVGVEKTFPFHSPLIQGVEVLRRAKVRRAKLYYLRGLSEKKIKKHLK